ncbi:MAG: GyrI-like domain-containing protein [Beijerinckiaceae bacterium]
MATGFWRTFFGLAAAGLLLCCSPAASLAAAPELKIPKPGTIQKPDGMPGIGSQSGNQATPAEKHDHGNKDGNDDKPSVIQTVDLPALPVIATTGKSTWDAGYGEIRSAIAALRAETTRTGLEPTGRPLVVYVESNDQDFRFDVMLPLKAAPAAGVKLSPAFRSGHNPGGSALKFEHRGAYAEIESTYEAITAYLDEKGLSARDLFIEEFVNDVAEASDIKMAVNIYVFLK